MAQTVIDIKDRLQKVHERIGQAAARSGRDASQISLVAVTKGVTTTIIAEAVAAGLTTLGENKVQEAGEKIPQVTAPVQWHMIGHLQSNKVKAAVELFSLIQSVDTVRLAEKISQEAVLLNKTMPVLLEVNVSAEEQKYGFKPEEVYSALDEVLALPNLKVMGLMGMAPNSPDVEARRAAFKKLKGTFGACKSIKSPNLEMKWLSMGMSDDFETAIEEGSSMVRIGRALFK